jgi:hypothetical protein
VDGSVIRNKYDLHEHNRRHGVIQELPGMSQDIESIQKDNLDKAFGKQASRERVEILKRVIDGEI